MIARKNNNTIEISFSYNPAIVAFVKGLEGRKWIPKKKLWAIPLAGSEYNIKMLQQYGFTIDLELWEAVKKDKEAAREAEALAVMDDTEFKTPLPLFPYQKVGAAFLYKVGSGLLGDDMGLGKTVQSLAVCEKAQAKKVLIFAPSAVKWQWAGEIERFLPRDTWHAPPSVEYPYSGPDSPPRYSETHYIKVIEGNAGERKEAWHGDYRFYIANYELLLRDFNEMDCREWDVIIADEATRISNVNAKQTKAIKKLRAARRIALTGTPISNRTQEIWSLIDFCQPGVLGSYWDFQNRYCIKNKWGGIMSYQNMDELKDRLKRYMIRRLKKDVLLELPEKISTDIPFALDDDEKFLYDKIRKEILFDINKEDINKIHNPMTIQYTLVKLLRLRQLTDSMELLGESTQSTKLDVLREKLEETLQGDRKAIIFTQFSKMADILERELAEWGVLKISGDVKEEYRDIVSVFNEDDNKKILIMTSAGQFGLNIQRASVIFHYDQEWSLAKMLQREGRAHRYGQKDTVLVYNLLAKGTVDMYVKKVLHEKMILSDKVLGDMPMNMSDIKSILTYEKT